MKGYCENCAKKENCRLEIGIVFGFCNTHFEPKEETKTINFIAKIKDSEPLKIAVDEFYYLTGTAEDLESARKAVEEYAQGDNIICVKENNGEPTEEF